MMEKKTSTRAWLDTCNVGDDVPYDFENGFRTFGDNLAVVKRKGKNISLRTLLPKAPR